MNFGQSIKEKRESLGMTQQDLAEKLYVSRQTVCRWENGTRCPDLLTAKKLSWVLGISMDELVTGDALQELVPVQEKQTSFAFLKVMLSGMVVLLIGLFLYVADHANMDIAAICFILGILTFAVGVLIPAQKGTAVMDDALPQRKCPNCGKEHDFDYPQCPFCDHRYS